MLKYLFVLLLLFGTTIAQAKQRVVYTADLIADIKKNEDTDKREEYIKLLYNIIHNSNASDSTKKIFTAERNRLMLVGKSIDLYGEDLQGKDICLCHEEYQGKVVIIDFWASWCGPCRMKMAQLKTIARKYKGSVEILGVNTDENVASAIAVEKNIGVTWRSIRKNEEIEKFMSKYGINFIPRLMVVGVDGKVVYLNLSKDIDKKLDALLKIEK